MLGRSLFSLEAIFVAREVWGAKRLTCWHGFHRSVRSLSCIPRRHSSRRVCESSGLCIGGTWRDEVVFIGIQCVTGRWRRRGFAGFYASRRLICNRFCSVQSLLSCVKTRNPRLKVSLGKSEFFRRNLAHRANRHGFIQSPFRRCFQNDIFPMEQKCRAVCAVLFTRQSLTKLRIKTTYLPS